MPFLNWTQIPAKIDVELAGDPSETVQAKLNLGLCDEHWEVLIRSASAIFEEGGHELRIDLPQNWTLFIKRAAGDSKFLVAHPETEQFVGTLALSQDMGKALLEAMKSGSGGAQGSEPVNLSYLGRPGWGSNFEFSLFKI